MRVLRPFQQLRFKQSQHLNDCSAAHVVVSFVSSEILKCRLLTGLLDHSMNHADRSHVGQICAQGLHRYVGARARVARARLRFQRM